MINIVEEYVYVANKRTFTRIFYSYAYNEYFTINKKVKRIHVIKNKPFDIIITFYRSGANRLF